jgi:RNA polymerase sigma factor for flagellar operon FliA
MQGRWGNNDVSSWYKAAASADAWKSDYWKAASTNLRSDAQPWTVQQVLPEEPGEVLLVNSESSGAYASLCADASEADLVAFDAEWAPDWDRGSDNPVSVLQLAFPQSARVYVLQLGQLSNRLPQAVQLMLVNPGVTKVGFAVGHKDSAKLARTGIALTKGSVVDVQSWCAAAMRLVDPPETLSLKRAASIILGFQLEKDKRCSCSDWASEKLTAEQIRYAALDAWVALRLYYQVSS